jgi:hypothetical protein
VSTQYTEATLINGATAGEWRLELHERGDSPYDATLLLRNTEKDVTVLEEDFTLTYTPIFGVDYEDLDRAEIRAEEAIAAWEEGQE